MKESLSREKFKFWGFGYCLLDSFSAIDAVLFDIFVLQLKNDKILFLVFRTHFAEFFQYILFRETTFSSVPSYCNHVW